MVVNIVDSCLMFIVKDSDDSLYYYGYSTESDKHNHFNTLSDCLNNICERRLHESLDSYLKSYAENDTILSQEEVLLLMVK